MAVDDSFRKRISPEAAASIVRRALETGALDEHRPSLIVHDLDLLEARVAELRQAFPRQTVHAVAIKANPVVGILAVLVRAGCGLEAASLEEGHLALAAGAPPERIYYDSPAKSRAELAEALDLGLAINADNLEELARLDALLGTRPPRAAGARIGLRVNPKAGAGRIAITSVSTKGSQFGTPVDDESGVEAVVAAFVRYPWLGGLHVHAGSAGIGLDLIERSVRRVAEVRARIHARTGAGRVSLIDVGGGLPAIYRPDDEGIALDAYVAALGRAAPEFFADEVQLVTELGRSLHAGCGFAVTRVEYVKQAGDHRVAIVHLGSDLLLRVAYHPQDWHHDLVVLDASGRIKTTAASPWTIAGPLCYAGDIIARDRLLPDLAPGDYLVVRDTGAYTLSLWSRYCSRSIPAVVGARRGGLDLEVLRRAETPADLVAFWSR